jgi:hypothetical protein
MRIGGISDMSASAVRCHVLEGDVSVISDLDGNVTNVVCPEFNRLTHNCLLKFRRMGLVGKIAANAVDAASGVTRLIGCEFAKREDAPLVSKIQAS